MDCINLKKDSSLIRILNASIDTLPVDVYINDKLAFNNISYKEFSKYLQMRKGNYRIDVCEANNKESCILKQTVRIEQGEVYTIAIIESNGNLSLLVINDYSSKATSDDYSSFRVINLSPYIDAVDIVVDEDILFKEIGYKEGTIYADVKINEYNVKIVNSYDLTPELKLKIKFKPYRIYTIYIIGNLPNLEILQSVDGNTYLCRCK